MNDEKNDAEDLRKLLAARTANRKRKLITRNIFLVTSLLFFMCMLFLLSNYNENPDTYFTKQVKVEIKKIIASGGQLDIVKHTYSTTLKHNKSIVDFIKVHEDIYPTATPLSAILLDIKKDYYTSGEADTIFLSSPSHKFSVFF